MRICPTCLEIFDTETECCPDDNEPLLAMAGATDERCGTVMAGRFLLLERLAQGSMGRVYRAWQISMQRDVALKVVPARLLQREPVRRRVLREARATGTLRSPHIVASYDSGWTPEGDYFIAMELLQGRPLSQLLLEEGPLPLPRALSILEQICRGLEAVHERGFVHRDLKPGNIIVEKRYGRDHVKLVDFGLVRSIGDDRGRITLSGETIGSPAYLSPEQAAGQSAGQAADLYSFGVIAFEMVSGQLPFAAHNVFQLMAMHIYAPPPPLVDVSGTAPAFWALGSVVKRCLAKDPVHRYGTARDLRLALAAIDPRGCDRPMMTPTGGLPEWNRMAREAPTICDAVESYETIAVVEPLGVVGSLRLRFPRLATVLAALAAMALLLAAVVRGAAFALAGGVPLLWTRFRGSGTIRRAQKGTRVEEIESADSSPPRPAWAVAVPCPVPHTVGSGRARGRRGRSRAATDPVLRRVARPADDRGAPRLVPGDTAASAPRGAPGGAGDRPGLSSWDTWEENDRDFRCRPASRAANDV